MSLSDRLSEIMQQKNISINDIKNAAEVSYEMARRYKLGTAEPRTDKLQKIADFLGVEASWLQFGVHTTDNKITLPIVKQPDNEHNHKIDLLDVKAMAGLAGYINPDYPDIITSIWLSDDGVLEILGRKNTAGINLINVPTDSMATTINKGDIVFIDSTVDCYVGEGVYFFELDGECFIKRLQKIPNGIVRALSDNKLYSSFDITAEQFSSAKVLGKFVKVLHITPQDL